MTLCVAVTCAGAAAAAAVTTTSAWADATVRLTHTPHTQHTHHVFDFQIPSQPNSQAPRCGILPGGPSPHPPCHGAGPSSPSFPTPPPLSSLLPCLVPALTLYPIHLHTHIHTPHRVPGMVALRRRTRTLMRQLSTGGKCSACRGRCMPLWSCARTALWLHPRRGKHQQVRERTHVVVVVVVVCTASGEG